MAKVEVVVEEANDEMEVGLVREAPHKLFLAGVGAWAMAQDALEDLASRLVKRGERVEKQGKRLLSERLDRRRNQVRRIVRREKEEILDAEEDFQAWIAERLDHMSVPTKDDLDALSAKIAELSKKVDELKEARTS